MRFERGKDPKESMSIGNASNPYRIADLYAASTDIPEEYRISPSSANIRQKSAFGIFESIEAGHIRDWGTRFAIGVYTGEVEKMSNGGENHKFQLDILEKYSGYYIEYFGRKYKLPSL